MSNIKEDIAIFWFRRDLRLNDNKGFHKALTSGYKVLPLFIFDSNILNELPKNDARVKFIHELLEQMNATLRQHSSGIVVKQGNPLKVWQQLVKEYSIKAVYYNEDYEPYGIDRDKEVSTLLKQIGISCIASQDHVIMHPAKVQKDNGEPFKVFTPFSKRWKALLTDDDLQQYPSENLLDNCVKHNTEFPSLNTIGFEHTYIKVLPWDLNHLENYKETRDFPAQPGVSYVSPHLRFGSISIRGLVRKHKHRSENYLNELIWREFFMQIMYYYPKVVNESFNTKYDNIKWRNNAEEFDRWCKGETGFPIVDAGMRQLNETGYMHNRVRMIVASFLCKDLLIDWRWGEAYFAEKLLDFELSSNNGNWQWAAGCGCDAAPYFRVFNPEMQEAKFDPDGAYVKTWVKNLNELDYPKPMVDHSFARDRALKTYKVAL